MYHLEDHYWWYNGLRHMVTTMLTRAGVSSAASLLDAGCGTGGILEHVAKKRGITGIGFDFAADGLVCCRQRGLNRLVRASINEIPFAANAFDVILSLDVLCHRSIRDDVAVLKDIHRALRPGGLVLLNLPAYDALKSSHDAAVHTAHRFNRREMRSKLHSAGFTDIRLSYRNTVLFPALAAVRLLRKRSVKPHEEGTSDLNEIAAPLNALLTGILYFENGLMRFIDLPFGLSLLCMARKS